MRKKKIIYFRFQGGFIFHDKHNSKLHTVHIDQITDTRITMETLILPKMTCGYVARKIKKKEKRKKGHHLLTMVQLNLASSWKSLEFRIPTIAASIMQIVL